MLINIFHLHLHVHYFNNAFLFHLTGDDEYLHAEYSAFISPTYKVEKEDNYKLRFMAWAYISLALNLTEISCRPNQSEGLYT